MRTSFCFVSLALALTVALVGCNRDSSDTSSGTTGRDSAFSGQYPINAVATVGMVADIVRTVGGEHVKVTQICGSGVDPHLYKPTRDDVQTMMGSDIMFYCGLMLEGKMSDTLIKMGRTKPVFAVTEMIDESVLLEPEDFAGHYDPHVWMDVSAWSRCISAVENALLEFDPAHTDDYQVEAAKLRMELHRLHQYGVDSIATIPEGSRILVTSHDAFNYFGRAYGLQVLGVQGLSTESEAGVLRINKLVDMLVDKGVKAVFIESSVSRKNIDALIEGAASKGHDVVVGGELFSDAMGARGTYEGTYIGMLDHNITTVTLALGGKADPKGLNGKLGVETSQESGSEDTTDATGAAR
ncbi:MAG: zinc ABC transporter solute-binding protein [Pirellulaceae bacterium]|nr:zinc ABC transporter solute-binding protein [Pirellulaceae bacterium]